MTILETTGDLHISWKSKRALNKAFKVRKQRLKSIKDQELKMQKFSVKLTNMQAQYFDMRVELDRLRIR